MDSKSFSATKTKRDRRNCSMTNLAHEGACSECTLNCMLVHRNSSNPSSSVDRFFKIMLGKDFLDVMLVPFKVAREKKWHKYINREACLEDTTGEKYPVKISEVDNVAAFKEGWCRFSSDHHLEEGDFLVFNHVRHVENLHFIVHIFGKSGEEKVFFSRGHDKNVSTMNRNAALPNKTLEADVMRSERKMGLSPSAVPKKLCSDVMRSDRKKGPSPSVVPKPLCSDVRRSDRKKGPSPSVAPKPLCSNIHHDLKTTSNTHSEYTDGKMAQLDPAPCDMDPLLLHRVEFIDDRCLYDLSSFENNDHPAPTIVSISNDESGTTNPVEKIMGSQGDLDLLDKFPVKKSSSPEPQSYKKQNAIIGKNIESAAVNVAPEPQRNLDLRDTLPGKRKFSSPEPQPYKKQCAIIENSIKSAPVNVALEMKMAVNDMERSGTHVPKIIERRGRFGPHVNVAPEMKMAVNDGKRSGTHVRKIIEHRDRLGPADNIPVKRDVSVSKTPSYKEKPYNKNNIDRSRPASSAHGIRQNVATGGSITVKKEMDIGDELIDHQQCLNGKKQTISPENVKRFSSNDKKEVKIPKTEPFRSEDIFASFVGMESSSAEVDDKPYLLLRSELPSVLSPREKLRTIYLRAPDSRKVLPVTYMRKNGVRVLTSGWQFFKSMNHLHTGDSCKVELEDASKRIYRFEVISRATVTNLK